MRRIDNATNPPAHRPKPAGAAWIRVWVLSLLAAVCVFVPEASSQIIQIDPATTQSVTLSGTQRTEIDKFLDQYASDAFSDDRAISAKAIDNLIDPLLGQGVSVAFRQAFSDRLIEQINEVLEDHRVLLDDKTINHKPYHALRLASEIATDRTLTSIVAQLKSEDPGRRYFAIHSIETVFYRMRTSAPAVTARTLLDRRQNGTTTGLIPDLGKMLAEEKSGRHASAIISALAEAADFPEEIVPGASAEAIRLIGTGAAARVRATAGNNAPPVTEDILSWLTASQRIVRLIAQPGSVDETTALAAVRLGGQLIASVYREMEAGRVVSADLRETDQAARIQSQMLGVAENLLLFGEQNAADDSGRRQDRELVAAAETVRNTFLKGNDSEFRRAALELISPNGILTAEPYGFKDNEFIVE